MDAPTAVKDHGGDSEALIDLIRASIIGADEVIDGPFGPLPVVYADYTASGRSLSFIEHYINTVVLPLYANTHTESSGTGLQTSRLREDARQLIRSCVGATPEHAVLFCGSGSTGAIDHLIAAMGLRIPSNLEDRFALSRHIPEAERPVVFIGPYEHHSNELPWRESIADVVTIDEDADGHVDVVHLERELQRHSGRAHLFGSFSAASNVTGIITDAVAVSTLLHRHGAKAFWDFAAAAPYVDVDMGSPGDGDGYFDAIFISPHKFIGGPGTPGLLVARNDLFTNRVPVVPGGGTVTFVNPTEHDYVDSIETREEGGTPDIIGSIRAGLVFQLKEAVGVASIKAREEVFVHRAIDAWDRHPRIQVLGSHEAERLSIVSFVIKDAGDQGAKGEISSPHRFLHHNFVVAVLNDLFGIQSRGGCSCAGPYGHRLLGIDIARSHEFQREIGLGCEGIKPGWVRVNFNYFIDDETADYIIDAVALVADEGRALLPHYRFEPATGLWRHRSGQVSPPLSLHEISYAAGEMEYASRPDRVCSAPLHDYMEKARHFIAGSAASAGEAAERPATSQDFESLRWFPYPDEARPAAL